MKNLLFLFLFIVTSSYASVMEENPLWLRYPAISPDGRYIVFSYKGDLYKVSSGGGVASPLTIHEAHDFMPVWSPDGKYIAFASDRYGNYDIFIIPSEGGTAKRLTFFSNGDFPSCFSADGKNVVYTSSRTDDFMNVMFPSGALPELYSVSIEGGREEMLLTIPAEDAVYNQSGTKLLFHDKKGYEDKWRKHHTSSVTRDVWTYEPASESYTKLTGFEGEDRNPVLNAGENAIYYLSERSGSFNIWKMGLSGDISTTQLTSFKNHPVRFLTISKPGTMCFSYDGVIYTYTEGSTPQKVSVNIFTEERYNTITTETFSNSATEFDISPNGKEVVFIVRGEVFVSSIESGTTKRITETPEQERSVSFSPDGKKILYASERNNIWGIYMTSIVRDEEKYFLNSTVLKEEPVVVTDKESFQPKFSTDGKEVAFLEERTEIKVKNLESGSVRTVLPGNKNYSYADGDQWFDWSPDSKYLLVHSLDPNQWITQIYLIGADGTGMVQLTKSGFENYYQKFAMNGNMMLWFSDRYGLRNHKNSGATNDVYGLFFNQEAFDRFSLSKEELMLLKEAEKENKDTVKSKEMNLELDGIENRKARLTIHSSFLADAVITPDGEQLFYLSRFEKGFDLWQTKFKDNETKLFMKLNSRSPGALKMDKDGKNLYMLSDGNIIRIAIDKNERKDVPTSVVMTLNKPAEREHLFEHIWRQVLKKFYVTDLQGVDWNFYKTEYKKFLPYINNNRDFAEMASEMLGELNASHTGCRVFINQPNGDNTASLGMIYDNEYKGSGVKIAEVLEGSPLINAKSKIKAGDIIEKIDGNEIGENTNFYIFLNRKAGKYLLLDVFNPSSGERWQEKIKPITQEYEAELLYRRWVKARRIETEKLSNGKIGYVHVRGMDDASFRVVYDEVLGMHLDKAAIIIDTRFNSGGNLHDELVTFFGGKKYFNFIPREKLVGSEPGQKWTLPSVCLVSESNYSDAHLFPVAYKELGLGDAVGMPVAGTGTAVWWERLMDASLVFGIPEVGIQTPDGKYLENNQFEPDYKVVNEYNIVTKNRDQQIEKSVDLLLRKIGLR